MGCIYLVLGTGNFAAKSNRKMRNEMWYCIGLNITKKAQLTQGLINDLWWRKTRIMGLSDRERISMIRSAVLIQYTRVTDRQTDGRTYGIGVVYTRYSIYAVARKKTELGRRHGRHQASWEVENPIEHKQFCRRKMIIQHILRYAKLCLSFFYCRSIVMNSVCLKVCVCVYACDACVCIMYFVHWGLKYVPVYFTLKCIEMLLTAWLPRTASDYIPRSINWIREGP